MSFYNSRLTLCDATLYNRENVHYGRLLDAFIRQSGLDPCKDETVFFTPDKLTTWSILNFWTGSDANGRLYCDPTTRSCSYDPTGHSLLEYALISAVGGVDAA